MWKHDCADKKDLKQIVELAKKNDQTVVLAFNKDIAEQRMSKDLAFLLEKEAVKYRVEVPTQGKSWNETIAQQASIQDPITSKQLLKKQWESFEEKPYEASLLRHLGIEKETYQAFQHTIKVNDKEMLMTLKEKQGNTEVPAIWHVNNSKGKIYQEYMEGKPNFSVLKGSLSQAEKIIFVTSPIEALMHYQEQAKTETKPDTSCYVYANAQHERS